MTDETADNTRVHDAADYQPVQPIDAPRSTNPGDTSLSDYLSPDYATELTGQDNADAYTNYSRGTAVITEAFEPIPISSVIKAGKGMFMGFTAYAATGLPAAAAVFLHDGLDATGPLIAIITAAPGNTNTLGTNGPVRFLNGLYMEVVSPFSRAILYTRGEIHL